MQPTNLTAEYRAQLTLSQPRCVVTITGSTPADVQNTVTQLLKGKTRFDSEQDTVLVFNDQHHEGQQAIGWIAHYAVPQNMSIKSLTEHRQGLQKVA